MSNVEQRLERLEAERDILATLHMYGHAIDYDWPEEYADCFVPDASLYWPVQGLLVGIEAIMEVFRRHTHAPRRYHKHIVAEPVIALNGSGRARVQSMFVRIDRVDAVPELYAFGRYLDDMVRCRDGKWRFASRRAETEAWRLGDPPVGTAQPEPARWWFMAQE